ncbi:MAG: hypothetical protein WBN77_12875 [Desulfobacterales bacterium]|uniref:Cytochrome c7-like domain-containing protein n=1 Tax=uncultured Desulfobacterium sp. TaxID=201089 RepID=E1YCB6_9BACT|nr:unknown protein [uncultured Desulfobacterium sp.]
MKQSVKVSVIIKILLTLFLIINLPAPTVFGANKLPKINKHKDKDIACESCHDKGSPYARPDDSICMGCHGRLY